MLEAEVGDVAESKVVEVEPGSVPCRRERHEDEEEQVGSKRAVEQPREQEGNHAR